MERINFGMVLCKAEETFGTDPVPTAAANLIAVRRNGLSFSPKFEHLLRQILDGTLGKTSGRNRATEVDFSLEVEIRGNRTNGTAADISAGAVANKIEIDPLLQACDLAPAYTAESPASARNGYVIYKPTVPSDEGESCTIYFYTGTKLHKITGCKGNVKGTLVAGQYGILTFEMKGAYNDCVDASIPGSPTWLNTTPPIFVSAGGVIGSYSPVFSKLDFDLGNQVVRRDDANAANGVIGASVVNRDSRCSIDPENVAEATHPIWGDLEDATSRTIAAGMGADTGNKFLATFTGVSQTVGYAERTGARICQIDYSLERATLSTTANNEFQLKFF